MSFSVNITLELSAHPEMYQSYLYGEYATEGGSFLTLSLSPRVLRTYHPNRNRLPLR